MNPLNPETKPIIGDDGELLEADQNANLDAYIQYVARAFPSPTRWEYVRQFMSGRTLFVLVIIILLIAFTYIPL